MKKKCTSIFICTCYFMLTGFLGRTQTPLKGTIAPSVLNATGGSARLTNTISIEWSVGELAVIEPMRSVNFALTHGILQPLPTSRYPDTHWSPDEIRIYPIPSSDWVNIHFFTIETGRIHLHIYDPLGRLVYQKAFDYNGNGHIEKINVTSWGSATYFADIELGIYRNSPSIQKKGTYKFQVSH